MERSIATIVPKRWLAGDTCRARNQKAMRDLMALLPQPAQRQDAGAAQTAAPL